MSEANKQEETASDPSVRVEGVVMALREAASILRDQSMRHCRSHNDDPISDAASRAADWVADAIETALLKLEP